MDELIKALEEYIKTQDVLDEELELLNKFMTNHELNNLVQNMISNYGQLLSTKTLNFTLHVTTELLEMQENFDSMIKNIDEILQKNLLLLIVIKADLENQGGN